jgi:hypothetical protein
MIVAAIRECGRLETNWKLLVNRADQAAELKFSVNFLETSWKHLCSSKCEGFRADAESRTPQAEK